MKSIEKLKTVKVAGEKMPDFRQCVVDRGVMGQMSHHGKVNLVPNGAKSTIMQAASLKSPSGTIRVAFGPAHAGSTF